MCGEHGTCTLNEETDAYCNCDDGYGGPLCIERLHSCSGEYFLNIWTSVYTTNKNAGMDCMYWIGLNWQSVNAGPHGEESHADSNDLSGNVAACTCLKVYVSAYREWANNVGCVIEEKYPYSMQTMLDRHCPDVNVCTQTATMLMKLNLQHISSECDLFIGGREYQPLAWRTPSKCNCLTSLGTRAEAAELVNCPFTLHAAGSDMIAYDNCADPTVEICDFNYVWEEMQKELLWRHPAAVETCSEAMRNFVETTPAQADDNRSMFSTTTLKYWCECYDAIATYWVEGLEVLDCLPVTFFEYTLGTLYQTYCYDPIISQRTRLWDAFTFVVPSASLEYSVGTWCYNAVVLMALAHVFPSTASDRTAELVCQCANGIQDIKDHNGQDFSWFDELANPYIEDTLGFSTQYCYDNDIVPADLIQTTDLEADVNVGTEDYDDSTTHKIFFYTNVTLAILSLLLCSRNCGWCLSSHKTPVDDDPPPDSNGAV